MIHPRSQILSEIFPPDLKKLKNFRRAGGRLSDIAEFLAYLTSQARPVLVLIMHLSQPNLTWFLVSPLLTFGQHQERGVCLRCGRMELNRIALFYCSGVPAGASKDCHLSLLLVGLHIE